MLPNTNVSRSFITSKFEIIVNDQATQDSLQCVRRKETTRTSLDSESEMHVRRTDSDEASWCSTDFPCTVYLFLITIWNSSGGNQLGRERVTVLGLSAPSEAVKGVWIRDEGRIIANWSCSEADMRFNRENETIVEGNLFLDDTVDGH